MEQNKNRDSADRTTGKEPSEKSTGDALDAAPPGSGIINSSRSGQAVSENPVLRADRDVADVLAPDEREKPEDGTR